MALPARLPLNIKDAGQEPRRPRAVDGELRSHSSNEIREVGLRRLVLRARWLASCGLRALAVIGSRSDRPRAVETAATRGAKSACADWFLGRAGDAPFAEGAQRYFNDPLRTLPYFAP